MIGLLLRGPRTLRLRLPYYGGLLLLMASVLVVWATHRVTADQMVQRENARLGELQQLFGGVLAGRVTAGNVADLEREAQQLRQALALDYLVVLDTDQRPLAAVGWDMARMLPPRHEDFRQVLAGLGRFDGAVPLASRGQAVGVALFGIDAAPFHQARNRALWRAVGAAALVMVFGLALFAEMGRRMSGVLRVLADGADDLAAGRTAGKLPVHGSAEMAALTRAINLVGERVRTVQRERRNIEERFHVATDYAESIEMWLNMAGRLIWISPSVERITGIPVQDCLLAGNVADLLVYSKDRRHALETAMRVRFADRGEGVELRLQRRDASLVWVCMSWHVLRREDGSNNGVRVSANVIQSRKEAELKLLETVAELRRTERQKEYYLSRTSEERSRLESLLNLMRVAVLFIGRDDRVQFCNRVFQRLWGLAEDESLNGVRDEALLARTSALRADDASFRRDMEHAVAEECKGTQPTFEVALTDGRVLEVVSTCVGGAGDDGCVGRIWIFEDITEQKRAAEQLQRLAERDPLTNLFNRRRFHEELERMVAEASRRGAVLGVMAFDLDGFKPVNDIFGHQAGDQVLERVAQAVGAVVRRNEMFFRTGGDEFAILAPESGEREMIGLARRVLHRVADLHFRFDGREAKVTASVGIAIFPEHSKDIEGIVAHADQAMYQAKANGRNRWEIYSCPEVL
ncbi:MAG: diguanylate cyclase [Betaproteobacteria bacterium]|nr:diguanylate cyclase [Betaproteobacteria bacterium]